MAKLKLAPLPDDKPVKLTITISAELAALLKAYAEAVGSADGGAATVERLIPPLVERFIRSDRAFMKGRRRDQAVGTEVRRPPVAGTPTERNS